ncbi:MAG TPA: hypothetical protein VI248_01230 [Kineosporiaceae bacterium]
MGYRNVELVVQQFGDLSGSAFKVLTCMAHWAHDGTDPPKYYKGRADLLLALGRVDPPDDDASPEADRLRNANSKALREAVAELRAAGIVSYAVTPTKHRTPEYFLHLQPTAERAARLASPHGKRAATRTENVRRDLDRRTETVRMPHENRAPKEKRPRRADQVEIQSPEVTTSPAAEDPYAAAHEILAQLPDLGAALLASVADGPLRERVIAAAALHLAAS